LHQSEISKSDLATQVPVSLFGETNFLLKSFWPTPRPRPELHIKVNEKEAGEGADARVL